MCTHLGMALMQCMLMHGNRPGWCEWDPRAIVCFSQSGQTARFALIASSLEAYSDLHSSTPTESKMKTMWPHWSNQWHKGGKWWASSVTTKKCLFCPPLGHKGGKRTILQVCIFTLRYLNVLSLMRETSPPCQSGRALKVSGSSQPLHYKWPTTMMGCLWLVWMWRWHWVGKLHHH